mmetsp:Transcript_17305/g.44762  ORF Transcript_17305/g.44762 Transcript_17305/m.44762 type:complete len:519 (-) Transcript_17305:21-1577(-)
MDKDTTERVLAPCHGRDVVLHERHRVVDDAVDGLESGLHRPRADGRLHVLVPVGVDQVHRRRGAHAVGAGVGARLQLERVKPPRLRGVGHRDAVDEDRLHIRVTHRLLLVGNGLELVHERVELLLVRRDLGVAQLDQALLEGCFARVLPEHERGVGADRLRRHDLVRRGVLEHAVLVDPSLVRERVRADDGLVRLHGDAGVQRHHLGRAHDLRRVDVDDEGVVCWTSAHGHHDLLERRVARALAQRVERHLDLPRARLDRRERVRGRQPEVVVAVRRPDDLLAALAVGAQVRNQRRVLGGHGVPDRVGDVERRRARLRHRVAQLDEEVRVRAPRILRRELDVVAHRLGVLHGRDCALDALGARDVELVLEVDVRRGEERVDAVEWRVAHRVVAAVQVLLVGAREARDAHRCPVRPPLRDRANLLRDCPDRLKVSVRGDRETSFAHVHSQAGELPRNEELLFQRERGARRLLTVAQRRVKDDDLVLRGGGREVAAQRRRRSRRHHPSSRRGTPARPREH